MRSAVVQTVHYFPPTLQRGRWVRSTRRGSRLRLQVLEMVGFEVFSFLRGRRRYDPLRLRKSFGTSPAGAWEEWNVEVDR